MCVTKLEDKCYRIQVVSTDDISNDCCEVKFLDYGGFDKIAVSELWQIRQDFLNLPFQVRQKLIYLFIRVYVIFILAQIAFICS